jgi:class 3 adenylate cyclase/TolB-like protein/Tfp pilus assembly protein PilF
MVQERAQRKLAAILAADVVGYSRLMSADETDTLAALKDHRAGLIDPKIAEFGGRIVKLMGDGMLVEFSSVVDAVECAVALQRGMDGRTRNVSDDRRITFRMGINLGDVIIDGDDIYGDGVNVAARLEEIAEPGGICISHAAYEQIRDKLDHSFVDQGAQALKNISRPVQVYRYAENGADAPSSRPGPATSRRLIRMAALATGLVAIVAAGWAGITVFGQGANYEPSSLGRPRLSIAVLPFKNLSGDTKQDYFADALTEDITADLSRISGSFVISRRTAATYRGKAIDAKRVARELKVRYLLEGTVRRARSIVRVSVQLTDGQTGQVLWSDRYEKTAGDMYAFQNVVTGRVARALNLELKEASSRQAARGGSTNPDSRDMALRAWAEIWNKPQSPATNAAGLAFVKRALDLDPNNAEALGVATYAYARAANYGWGMSRADGIRKGIKAGERAVALNPKNADAIYSLGFIYYVAGDTRRSLELMRQCIQLNRNHAPAYFFSGVNLIRMGKPRDGIRWIERAFALSPRDPLRSVWFGAIGRAHVILGEDERAIEVAQKGIAANRKHPYNHAVLAAAYAHLGRAIKAKAALARLAQVMRNATVHRFQLSAASTDPVAIKSYQRFLVGLHKAGLPEK